MSDLKNLFNCRVCNSKKLSNVINFKPMPIGENFQKFPKKNQKLFDLNVLSCTKCGLAQIKQVINPKILYNKYLYQTKTSIELNDHFEKYAKEVKKIFGKNKKISVLDIGSNDGSLLKYFKKNKCRVLGVEPAKHIAKIANMKLQQ